MMMMMMFDCEDSTLPLGDKTAGSSGYICLKIVLLI
jgi:hypothetical protein